MLAVSTWLLGIVSFSTSTLFSIPGKNAGIYIGGVVVKLQVPKKPLVQQSENLVINGSTMLVEKALKGFTARHSLKSPALPHYFIVAGYLTMLKFISTTPYTGHKLFDEPGRRIATVRTLAG